MVTDFCYQRPAVTDNNIKIIAIDEKTLEAYGPMANWSREIYARLIDKVNENEEYRPSVIAFDILMTGSKDDGGDELLAKACQKYDNVITAVNVVYDTVIERYDNGISYNKRNISGIEMPYDELAAASDYAFANTILDSDNYIRHTQLYVDINDESGTTRMDSLAFASYKAWMTALGKTVSEPELDSLNQAEFSYSGKPGAYEALSMVDIIEGNYDTRLLKDCLLMVGAYAPGLGDAFNVPIDKGNQMYGAEIHANIVQSLIYENFAQSVSALPYGILSALAAGIFWWVINLLSPLPGLILMLAIGAAHVGAGILLRKQGLTMPLAYLAIVVVVCYVYRIFVQYLKERRDRERTLSAFKKYVAPEIVEELSRKGELKINLGGTNRNIAVLFVDIRGFTTMSESLTPEEVVEILNEYLAMTTKAVFDNKGTLDKFVGDCTMAVFNAPFDLDDYIFRAVCTAYDIASASNDIETRMMEKYGKTVGFGVGVHCGPAVVGNIGCDVRMDYTAIGDTVNTAARLEANAPKGKIYVSEEVYQALSGRIEAECVGQIPLKGKTQGVTVYSVTGVEGKKL